MHKWLYGFLVIISIVCVLLFAQPPRAFAAGEFQADYNVEYAVAPSGITIVTQNVTLTNKESNLYPQKYSIIIDSQRIKNVLAYDNGGLVTPQITQTNGKTDIILAFNQQVVGLGKQLHFSLRYEDDEIARKLGTVWEINIPGVANDPDLASYTVTLRVPPIFGTNAYMTPPPASGTQWTKDQMVSGGISAAYGTEQDFDLGLSYYLSNPGVSPKSAEIALPPNTAFQKILIKSINPKPETVLKDDDGNWLAQYNLLPGQSMEVETTITAAIHLNPYPQSTEPLVDRSVYLRPQKYWETQSQQIEDLAKTYKTPHDIYNYVTHALSYDYTRVNGQAVRKGALAALADPTHSICMEFTDLFVAIARAAGIPAREVIGYAYTTNSKLRPLSLVSDVLHAWPEFYDDARKIWIPVDPTWANTTGGIDYFDKLDFNHIAFSLEGVSSEYPYPAGFYKKPGSTTKDVQVQFADSPPNLQEGKLTVSYVFAASATSGLPVKGTVIVENDNGTAVHTATVGIQTLPFDVGLTKTYTDVPPLARISIPVTMPLPGYFLKGTGVVAVNVNGETTQFDFDIKPFVYTFIIPLFILSLILVVAGWVLAKRSNLWKHQA